MNGRSGVTVSNSHMTGAQGIARKRGETLVNCARIHTNSGATHANSGRTLANSVVMLGVRTRHGATPYATGETIARTRVTVDRIGETGVAIASTADDLTGRTSRSYLPW